MIIECKNCGTKRKACRKTQLFCSIKCAVIYRYNNGFIANTESAHNTIKEKGHYKRDNTYLKVDNPASSRQAREKNSESKIGSKNPMYGKVGKLHHNWRGGKTKDFWKSVEYQRWRKDIMRRDSFTCQICGDNSGGNLEVHHIKPRILFPELSLKRDNGITLCKDCHKHTDTWGFKVKKFTRSDFV